MNAVDAAKFVSFNGQWSTEGRDLLMKKTVTPVVRGESVYVYVVL